MNGLLQEVAATTFPGIKFLRMQVWDAAVCCRLVPCVAWHSELSAYCTYHIRLGVVEPDRGGPRGPARAHHL